MDDDTAQDDANVEVNEVVKDIEDVITRHHGTELTRWTNEQQDGLDISSKVDSLVLELQQRSSETCLNEVASELERLTRERRKASSEMAKYRSDRGKDFARELRQLGEDHAVESASAVRGYTSKVRAMGEAWDASAWDRLERQLGAVSWQQARMVHATNPTAGVADVYTRGALNDYLAQEEEGWARSQQNDLDRLQKDIQDDAGQVLKNLQTKLKKMAPEAILVQPWIERLNDMVSAEKDRLKVLEQEATNAYESEIDAAMWQCSEDYHGYDSELQRILVRCLDERTESLTKMRELKMALCRWRLHYQKTYDTNLNSMRTEYSQRRNTNTILTTAKLTAPRRFLMVRRLMRRLWTHGKVPHTEIHNFLMKVTEAAVRKGAGKELLELYEKEIASYGATPLIKQADDPDLLDTWMGAITLHKGRSSDASDEK